MNQAISVGPQESFLVAICVLFLGQFVNRFGPSPQAFMVVPIVSVFFIDIVNLVILQGCISFIK